MPVGFEKYCWKSSFVEPDLGNFIDALSCASGQDTPNHIPWKQSQFVSLLFQDQVLCKMLFLSHPSNKKVQLSIFESQENQEATPVKKYFPDVLRLSCFSSWVFCMLTLGSPPALFLLHFMTNPGLRIDLLLLFFIGLFYVFTAFIFLQVYFDLNLF